MARIGKHTCTNPFLPGSWNPSHSTRHGGGGGRAIPSGAEGLAPALAGRLRHGREAGQRRRQRPRPPTSSCSCCNGQCRKQVLLQQCLTQAKSIEVQMAVYSYD